MKCKDFFGQNVRKFISLKSAIIRIEVRYTDHDEFILGSFVSPPAAEPVLLPHPRHDELPAGADGEAVDEPPDLYPVHLLDAPEALAHLPHPEPAIPGACDDGVSVVKGGQGRDPVGIIITGVGPVTPLYLASKQT